MARHQRLEIQSENTSKPAPIPAQATPDRPAMEMVSSWLTPPCKSLQRAANEELEEPEVPGEMESRADESDVDRASERGTVGSMPVQEATFEAY